MIWLIRSFTKEPFSRMAIGVRALAQGLTIGGVFWNDGHKTVDAELHPTINFVGFGSGSEYISSKWQLLLACSYTRLTAWSFGSMTKSESKQPRTSRSRQIIRLRQHPAESPGSRYDCYCTRILMSYCSVAKDSAGVERPRVP